MRLFLQREGKDEEAVKFGVLSYICWGFALHKQTHAKDADRFFVSERKGRLQSDFSSENIRSTVTKLLKKAGKAELTPKVTSIVEEYVKRLPDINLGQIAGEIDESSQKQHIEPSPLVGFTIRIKHKKTTLNYHLQPSTVIARSVATKQSVLIGCAIASWGNRYGLLRFARNDILGDCFAPRSRDS